MIGSLNQEATRQKIEALIQKLHIKGRVIVTGSVKRDAVPALLCNSDILALARPANKQAEGGFPTKLGEYLATGNTVVVTNASGKVRFKADGDKDYSLKCDNQNYYLINTSTTTKGKRFSETVNVDVAMKKIKVNSPAIWEGVAFNKKDWQLKLSSSKALSSLVTLLSENPRLQIEIGSYTDSRGKDPENLSLTQRRAELVMQYLIAQGIKADRLTAKGYGETKLLNHCINGLLCIEEEHEINNRIEITVTSISKDTALK